jgi:hypothetical protein
MDCFGTAISMSLQYGVPLEVLVNKFSHTRFDPMGHTTNPEIRIAKSVVDYIFRWMGMNFLNGYREASQGLPLKSSSDERRPPPGPPHRLWRKTALRQPLPRRTCRATVARPATMASSTWRCWSAPDWRFISRTGPAEPRSVASSLHASKATLRPVTTAVRSPSAMGIATSVTTAATAWVARDSFGQETIRRRRNHFGGVFLWPNDA